MSTAGGLSIGGVRNYSVATLVLMTLLVLPATAEARRGIVVYQSGEDVFDVGELPESVTPDDGGWRAGYRCSVFGLFWALFHKWDCKAVAYRNDEYSEDAAVVEAIEAKYSTADIEIDGFWAAHGRWFLGGSMGLLLVLAIFGAMSGDDDEDGDDEDDDQPDYASDPRYIADQKVPMRNFAQGAMAIYQGNSGDPGYWPQDTARTHLEDSWSTQQNELDALLRQYVKGEMNPGFDKVRIIWLARCAAGAGWLSHEVSWRWAARAAAEQERSQEGWGALAEAVEAGVLGWYNDEPPPETRARVERCINEAWVHVLPRSPFHTPLA